MSTYCRVVQLLEPDPDQDLEITDTGGALSIEEGGALALVVGQTEYAVPFAAAKVNPDYDFTERDISNEDDADPLVIDFTISDRTVDGFTLLLGSQPDTANYTFRWRVQVISI